VDVLHILQIKIIVCVEMVMKNILQYLVLVLFVKCEFKFKPVVTEECKFCVTYFVFIYICTE
jgi:hypothetical protein